MTSALTYDRVVYTAFLVLFSYFVILTLYYLILALIGMFETRNRTHESDSEKYSSLYLSPFIASVSIVIPAHNEEEWIRDCLLSVLNLNYPKFEVIIVDDCSTDSTLKILNDILKLKPINISYPKHYKDGMVKETLISENYPNVIVISKSAESLKKAGAVNAGLNLAKYEYVCVLDADTIIEPDALIKVMAHIEKNPDSIVGAGSYFGMSNGLKIKNGRILQRSFSYNPILAYQNLEYIRSFIGNRVAWSKFNAMPNVAGGFGIWRKDILYSLGGYSTEFTCEDVELTFRVHDYIVRNGKGQKILMLPYYVGWTEGPSNFRSLISQRERWQRVTNETIWKYKYMILNPRFGSFAFITLPYFLLYEVFGVFFEIASIAFVIVGWLRGVLDLRAFLSIMALMILSQVVISLICIFSFLRNHILFKLRYVVNLVALSWIELFWYRWVLSIAKLVGTFNYIRGKKQYGQYTREKRAA